MWINMCTFISKINFINYVCKMQEIQNIKFSSWSILLCNFFKPLCFYSSQNTFCVVCSSQSCHRCEYCSKGTCFRHIMFIFVIITTIKHLNKQESLTQLTQKNRWTANVCINDKQEMYFFDNKTVKCGKTIASNKHMSSILDYLWMRIGDKIMCAQYFNYSRLWRLSRVSFNGMYVHRYMF